MATPNPFPLQIIAKINDPELVAILAQYGHDKYVNAEDLNLIIQALNFLQENINGDGESVYLTYQQYLDDVIPRLEGYQAILTAENFGAFIEILPIKNILVDADEVISKNNITGKTVKTSWLNVWLNHLAAKVDAKILAALNLFSTAHFLDFTSSGQTQLDSKIPLSQKAAINGVATLGADGKIPNNQLPALAISETFPVSTQAEMLSLSQAEQGDIAIRSDINKSFILREFPASNLSNWNEMLTPTDSVNSVDGQVGNVNLSAVYEPRNVNTAGFLPRTKAGGVGTEDSSIKSATGDNETPSSLELDGTYRVGIPLWNKLKLYLFKGINESYGFAVGGLADLQYWAGSLTTGTHRWFTARTERFSIGVEGNIKIFNLIGAGNKITMTDADGVLKNSAISETNDSVNSTKRIVSKAGINGGFESASFDADSANNIWRFAIAPGYGIAYYQRSVGGDYIGFHFGSQASPQLKFGFDGRIGIANGLNSQDAVALNQLIALANQVATDYVPKYGNATIYNIKQFNESPRIPDATESNHPVSYGQYLIDQNANNAAFLEVIAANSPTTEWINIDYSLPSSFVGVILRYKIKNGTYILDFKATCNGSGVAGSVTDELIATLPRVDSEKLKCILLDNVFSNDNGDGISRMKIMSDGDINTDVGLYFTYRDVVAYEEEVRAALPIALYNNE